ncbi:MAG: glycosyltransferase family 4 protein, partial [Phycisphaerales bacterium JB039]
RSGRSAPKLGRYASWAPMRIRHISTRLILGGSQENTVLSCEGQVRLGHEVHLAFGPIYGPEGSMLDRVAAFATGDGRAIETHEVPDMVRQVNPLRDLRARGQLRRLIAAIAPDIVHTHSSKAGILGRQVAWGAQPRPGVVHTVHGPPFMPIEGGMAQRGAIRAKNLLYTLAERHAAKRCHQIVCVADAMRDQYLARGIGRPEQYVTVRSGMEVEAFLEAQPGETRAEVRAELGLGERDFVIGTVARLAQHKGHDDVLDALSEEMRSRPDWKLLWVGDGWWRERLLRRAGALGLAGQVITTGLVEPARVAPMIRAMDLLVHPSYREGLPRTVPQALLCAVPVVAYDVDGTREACIEQQTGRLVGPGNIERLRESILWMAQHPAERRAMAERGREMCREMFSAGRMVEDLERVYERALELAGRRASA